MRPMSLHEGSLERTVLPPEPPERTVVSPTLNRWRKSDGHGALVDMVHSVEQVLSNDRTHDRTMVLIGDATKDADNDRVRGLSHATNVERPTDVYVMTPESRQELADRLEAMTHLPRHVINALVTETGYAGQRAALDVAARGKVATFDDDTKVPPQYGVVRPDRMPHGFQHLPNSQVLLLNELSDHDLDWYENSLEEMFRFLGKNAQQLSLMKDVKPPVTRSHIDTMHMALPKASLGEVAQFEVSHAPGEELDEDDAEVVAAWPIKYGVPDYRTVVIARAWLRQHFPEEEVPVLSYLSGPSLLYAHQISQTNVDSAAFARNLDEANSRIPWWFISSLGISQANRFKTVNAHYRADNELLPHLLRIVSQVRGKTALYVSGLQTQVSHHRARTGYRPDLHEQAAASLIGNVAATEAMDRLDVDPQRKVVTMEDPNGKFRVPRDKARSVYEQLQTLVTICAEEGRQAEGQYGSNHPSVQMYKRIHDSVVEKLAGLDYTAFHQELNKEVGDQLRFFRDVVNAYPVIMECADELRIKEQFPAFRFVPSRQRTRVTMSTLPNA